MDRYEWDETWELDPILFSANAIDDFGDLDKLWKYVDFIVFLCEDGVHDMESMDTIVDGITEEILVMVTQNVETKIHNEIILEEYINWKISTKKDNIWQKIHEFVWNKIRIIVKSIFQRDQIGDFSGEVDEQIAENTIHQAKQELYELLINCSEKFSILHLKELISEERNKRFINKINPVVIESLQEFVLIKSKSSSNKCNKRECRRLAKKIISIIENREEKEGLPDVLWNKLYREYLGFYLQEIRQYEPPKNVVQPEFY